MAIASEVVRAKLVQGLSQKRSVEMERHANNLQQIKSPARPVAATGVSYGPPAIPAEIPAKNQSLLLPSKEETVNELKRRLGKELYRAELDLVEGLKIAGKPCDCLDHKHTLMIEAAAEELIAQDPANSVYRDIIDWVQTNRPKLAPAAIASGQYDQEYPVMAGEFQQFRKRVFSTLADQDKAPEECTTCQRIEKVLTEYKARNHQQPD
ncbi:MAG: hypothetical protein WC359_12550 [Dehalococcoidia bacterium]